MHITVKFNINFNKNLDTFLVTAKRKYPKLVSF